MTDNKVKDNEIIKALKCVPKDASGYIIDENNKMKLVYNEDVIDLINHLQSQNKDLAETVLAVIESNIGKVEIYWTLEQVQMRTCKLR